MPIRVLHITPTFYPSVGGIETVVRGLMNALRRRGFIVDAMHIAPGNKLAQERLDDGVVWRFPLFPNRLVGLIPPARSILMSYDVLHVHDPQTMALSLNILLQGGDRKKVLSTHGGFFHTSQYSLMKALYWKLLAPVVINQYDEVLASSQSDCELFSTKFARTKLAPNGVDVEKFFSIVRTNPPRPTQWLYWGRLSQNKRIDTLIETVAQARNSGLPIDLLIAGEDFDGLASSLLARIERLGLQSHIRMAGSLSEAELKCEIATRSVFISASEHEGFGLSIVEAMAAGMIVICRDMAPLDGFITRGRNGILIKFDGSHDDLSLIQGLCGNSCSELLNMQQEAREAASVHGWDSAIKPFIEVYEQLMSER